MKINRERHGEIEKVIERDREKREEDPNKFVELIVDSYDFFTMIKSLSISREKGITTLKIYQYRIFHHTRIETCFEMLKSSEHKIS